MENDEPLDPMNVSFLCARAIVTRANRLAHLIKQLRFPSRGRRLSAGFCVRPAVDHSTSSICRGCVLTLIITELLVMPRLLLICPDPFYPSVNVDSTGQELNRGNTIFLPVEYF